MNTLKEQRQESDHEHKENTDNAVSDPLKHGNQVVATSLASQELAGGGVLAYYSDRRIERSEEHH